MYIEFVFIENFVINFFILFCLQKIFREKSKLIWLGSLFASLISLLCPLFNLNLTTSIIIKISLSILLPAISFKVKGIKKNIALYACFLIITFMFGGAVEFLRQLVGEVNFVLIISCSFVMFMILKSMINFLNKKKVVDNFIKKVVIIDGKRKVQEKGYYDSGNLLYDPITNEPICLINHQVFEKLFECDILSVFMKKIDQSKFKNGHYIEVNSAVKGGKMFVFSVDDLIVFEGSEKKEFKKAVLGLSFSGFEKAMNSSVLLHSSQICA